MHAYVCTYVHTLHYIALHYIILKLHYIAEPSELARLPKPSKKRLLSGDRSTQGKSALDTSCECHLRIAGCLERGAEGNVILKELLLVLLAPGSRPPTESLKDVQHAGFFQRLVKSKKTCTAFNSVLRPMFVCNSQDMSGPKSL